MNKVLALLSGKGGSGKTTLALSIASMLSSCYLKVLLVDCDLSTNGATYFFEEKLMQEKDEIGSFYKIFVKGEDKIGKLIKINEYMDFMPSIIKITKANSEAYCYKEQDLKKMQIIDGQLRKLYDVIIYDCQAGYTDILKLILPYVDVNLVVMEADAISSASIRSFYLKVGHLLNDKKIYQIFNKATDEEYEIYSKISGGTVFTNIETVMFDWKIRKSFSTAQIPDLERTSARYGEQVFNICKILFNEEKIQKKIKKYDVIIKLNKVQEKERQLQEIIDRQDAERKNFKNKMIKIMFAMLGPMFAALIVIVITDMIRNGQFLEMKNDTYSLVISGVMVLICFGLTITLLGDTSKEIRNRAMRVNIYNKKLNKMFQQEAKLEKQLKQIENQEEDMKDKISDVNHPVPPSGA